MVKNRSVCHDHKFIIIIMNMVNIVHMWSHTPRCNNADKEGKHLFWMDNTCLVTALPALSLSLSTRFLSNCCCCVLSAVFASIVMSCQSIFAAVAKYVWSVPIISSFSLNFKWHINHWKCKQINNMGRMHRTTKRLCNDETLLEWTTNCKNL